MQPLLRSEGRKEGISARFEDARPVMEDWMGVWEVGNSLLSLPWAWNGLKGRSSVQADAWSLKDQDRDDM